MTLALLAAVVVAAFATEGAIGFGSTVLTVTIGAQLIPMDVLLPAFVPVNMALSTYLLATTGRAIAWRYLLTQVAPAVGAGAAVGLALFRIVPAKTALALAFGVFVVGLAVLRLLRPTERPLGRVRFALLALGGVAHGLFGTGGPMIVYVARRQVPDKGAFRATLAVLWFALNIALLANFASAGLYDREVARVMAVLAATVVPGLAIGVRVHDRLDAQRFELIVWLVLLVVGGALAVRSALAL